MTVKFLTRAIFLTGEKFSTGETFLTIKSFLLGESFLRGDIFNGGDIFNATGEAMTAAAETISNHIKMKMCMKLQINIFFRFYLTEI